MGSCAPCILDGSCTRSCCLQALGCAPGKCLPQGLATRGGVGWGRRQVSPLRPCSLTYRPCWLSRGTSGPSQGLPELHAGLTFSSSTSSQPNLWQPSGPSPVLGRTHGPNYPRSAWLIRGNSQPHHNTKAPSVTKLLNGINPIPTMCSLVWLPPNTCSVIPFRPWPGSLPEMPPFLSPETIPLLSPLQELGDPESDASPPPSSSYQHLCKDDTCNSLGRTQF